jgi:hypothetical protein
MSLTIAGGASKRDHGAPVRFDTDYLDFILAQKRMRDDLTAPDEPTELDTVRALTSEYRVREPLVLSLENLLMEARDANIGDASALRTYQDTMTDLDTEARLAYLKDVFATVAPAIESRLDAQSFAVPVADMSKLLSKAHQPPTIDGFATLEPKKRERKLAKYMRKVLRHYIKAAELLERVRANLEHCR